MAEFQSLVETVTARGDGRGVWWQVFIHLVYTVGLRVNEILNLTWADVDFADDSIRVVAKPDVGEL